MEEKQRLQICFNTGFAWLFIVDVEVEKDLYENDLGQVIDDTISMMLDEWGDNINPHVLTSEQRMLEIYGLKEEDYTDVDGNVDYSKMSDDLEDIVEGDNWYAHYENGTYYCQIDRIIDGAKDIFGRGEDFYAPDECNMDLRYSKLDKEVFATLGIDEDHYDDCKYLLNQYSELITKFPNSIIYLKGDAGIYFQGVILGETEDLVAYREDN